MTHEKSLQRYHGFLKFRGRGWTYRRIARRYSTTPAYVYERLKLGPPKSRVRNGNSVLLEKYKISRKIGGRERTRMLVRIRDKFTCQDCKKVRGLREVRNHNSQINGLSGKIKLFDVHHLQGLCGKKSRVYDRVTDIHGLVTLCHRCHYNRPEHGGKKRI